MTLSVFPVLLLSCSQTCVTKQQRYCMSMDLSIDYSYSSVPANYYLPHCAFLTTVCTHTCSHGASNSVGGILSVPLSQAVNSACYWLAFLQGWWSWNTLLHSNKGGTTIRYKYTLLWLLMYYGCKNSFSWKQCYNNHYRYSLLSSGGGGLFTPPPPPPPRQN